MEGFQSGKVIGALNQSPVSWGLLGNTAWLALHSGPVGTQLAVFKTHSWAWLVDKSFETVYGRDSPRPMHGIDTKFPRRGVGKTEADHLIG